MRTLAALTVWLVTALPAFAWAVEWPADIEENERWVLVDTTDYKLVVYDGTLPLVTFNNIAIGRAGTTTTPQRGDLATPLGEFRIDRINGQSRFHLFFGLDYPTLRHADASFTAGVISREDYRKFLDGLVRYGRPPQNTALGGNIGIHGIGQGDAQLHRAANWTEGCVALEDAQMDVLSGLVGIGTRVIIR